MSVVVNPQIVLLYDANGVAHAVKDGVAIPVNTPALLVAGHDDGAIARVMRTAVDGTVRVDPTGTTTQPVSNAAFAALDVLLSSRASEFTLAAFLTAFNAEDFATQTTLAALLTAFNAEDFATETTLLTRATEATLLLIKAKTDNLDVLLSTRASEATLLTRATEATLLTRATEATLLTRATEATLLTRLSKADFEARINTLGQKTAAASTPVVLPSDQVVNVTFGFGPPGTAFPKTINISFDKSDGAIVASSYKRVATYTIPATFSAYVIKFATGQGETATARLVVETNLGSHNDSTNVFTPGATYTSPQWAPFVQAEVTTAFAAGAGNVVLTVGYTNENLTAGRTGTITIPKGSAIGSRFSMVLQAGDLGVFSIQSCSGAPLQVGISKLLGFIQLVVHQDQSAQPTFAETIYAPGAVSFPTGTVIGIEYAGGTVAKQRTFDLLLQLVS